MIEKKQRIREEAKRLVDEFWSDLVADSGKELGFHNVVMKLDATETSLRVRWVMQKAKNGGGNVFLDIKKSRSEIGYSLKELQANCKNQAYKDLVERYELQARGIREAWRACLEVERGCKKLDRLMGRINN
jgi:hypothetical protein